ncbi:hypothetical protein CsSME_00050974 [Camellia sinensis var. sinensis]
MLFLNGLPEAHFEKRAIRLTGYRLYHDGNTNLDFYRDTLFDHSTYAPTEMHVSVWKSGYQAYGHQYFENQLYLRFI